jgi:ketosteroid isomerase-like protein
MDTETTRQLVRRFLDARAANDRDAMAELLTEDAGWYPPPSTRLGPFEGREAAVAALGGGAIGKVLDVNTIKRTVHRIIAEGDTAVVLQRLEGDLLAGGGYRNEYVWIYTCRDGRIARLDEFTDTLYAGRTFGWVKS